MVVVALDVVEVVHGSVLGLQGTKTALNHATFRCADKLLKNILSFERYAFY